MDNSKLKEMIDSKFPLLEKFRENAPGTFKHCQNVSNMCESIALELGLDTIVMTIAGMYHDIGKLNNPEYFSENQNGTNVHDSLEPNMSYQMITRHVGDSVMLLLQIEDFPREILKIISQHHGDTVLKYFFDKSSSKVDSYFRYKCSKPQTVEAAVLMISDCVEAQVRSEFKSDDFDEETTINSIIDRLINDEQLDVLQIGDLRTIKKVLIKEMKSTFHKRIDYKENEEKIEDSE